MIQKKRNKNLRTMLVKALISLTILVWLSSFIQLAFFSQLHESKTMLMISGAWCGGVMLDFISICLFILPGIRSGKISSPLTGSVVFYLASSIIYGQPILAIMAHRSVLLQPVLFQSFVKVIEFWILITFHVFCTIFLPNFIEDYIERQKLKQ